FIFDKINVEQKKNLLTKCLTKFITIVHDAISRNGFTHGGQLALLLVLFFSN
ncbi:unnamed protein product, partial [Adineta ricciae]